MSDLSTPRFADLPPPAPVAEHYEDGDSLPAGVIAAIRYDYEVALLAMCDVVRKYTEIVGRSTAERIMKGQIHPEIRAAHHRLAWCLRVRRKQC